VPAGDGRPGVSTLSGWNCTPAGWAMLAVLQAMIVRPRARPWISRQSGRLVARRSGCGLAGAVRRAGHSPRTPLRAMAAPARVFAAAFNFRARHHPATKTPWAGIDGEAHAEDRAGWAQFLQTNLQGQMPAWVRIARRPGEIRDRFGARARMPSKESASFAHHPHLGGQGVISGAVHRGICTRLNVKLS